MGDEITARGKAKRAILLSVIGILVLGFVLGPFAIVQALRIRKESEDARTLATVALVIGILATLSGIAVLLRIGWNLWTGSYPPGP